MQFPFGVHVDFGGRRDMFLVTCIDTVKIRINSSILKNDIVLISTSKVDLSFSFTRRKSVISLNITRLLFPGKMTIVN